MKSYLYAVQDANGREVVSATVEVEKVSDVSVSLSETSIGLRVEGQGVVADGGPGSRPDDLATLTLHRWPADDKLAKPVSHPVK